MNSKKKTSTNILPIKKNSTTKKKLTDPNHTSNEDIVDESNKSTDKQQLTKKNIKINTTNINANDNSLSYNSLPYKSYRKHIDRTKNPQCSSPYMHLSIFSPLLSQSAKTNQKK